MTPAMEPPRWRKDLRNAGEFVRKSVPVNKSSSSGEQGRRFPEVHSGLVRRVLAFGSVGMGALTRRLHPERRSGRAERFGDLMVQALQERWGLAAGDMDVEVRVHESFGKPALISVDVAVGDVVVVDFPDGSAAPGAGDLDGKKADFDVLARENQDQAHLARDIAEQCLQAAWNNPEIAPVAVRVSVRMIQTEAVTSGDDVPAHQDVDGVMPVVATAKSLGFADETARPAELYQRFGAPAFDPSWRP